MSFETALARFEQFTLALSHIGFPLAIVALGLIFRSELRPLIPRLRKIGRDGAEFSALEREKIEVQKVEAKKVGEESALHLKPLVGRERTAAVSEVEFNVKRWLNDFPEEDRLDYASLEIARLHLNFLFATTYIHIFGSQIALLKILKSKSLTIKEVNSYLIKVGQEHEVLASMSVDQYLSYLVNSGLIIMSDNEIKITNAGVDFLMFIFTSNYSEDRPL